MKRLNVEPELKKHRVKSKALVPEHTLNSFKKISVLTAIVLYAISGLCFAETETPPLGLHIATVKEEYAAGSTIQITYEIKNTSETPIGFYVRDHGDFALQVTDESGRVLKKHDDASLQRGVPSAYPDEYISLEPGQTRQGHESFVLKSGQVIDHLQPRNKMNPGMPAVIHDGFYIVLPSYMPHDHILIPDSLKTLTVVLSFRASRPNPMNFTSRTCLEANIPLDLFPEDFSSGRILSSSIKCEGKSCLEPDGRTYSNRYEFGDLLPAHDGVKQAGLARRDKIQFD